MFLTFILIFMLINNGRGWESPAFLPNKAAEGLVQMEEANDKAIIRMNENIKDHIIVAYINYKGESVPTVGIFEEPPSSNGDELGAIIERSTGDNPVSPWALVITKKQDYDDKYDGFRYKFQIDINSEYRSVYIKLNNVDDQPPYIQVNPSSNPCKIKENVTGKTGCTFNITDKDGIVKDMRYTLVNNVTPDINSYFEMQNTKELKEGLKEWQTELYVKKDLDFEKISSYMIHFTVTDSGGNTYTTSIIIQVIDVPDRPPVWTSIFSYITIPEKERMSKTAVAIDGDVAIAAVLNYKIITQRHDLFKVEKDTGEVIIGPIDRDDEKQEIFNFTIRAYEKDDATSYVEQSVTVNVQDKNDHYPNITVTKDSVSINESSISTLDTQIEINDLDLGKHATYKVSLTPTKFSDAFRIVPPTGYQKASFFISVVNSEPLDYEDPEWRKFDLEIRAAETVDETRFNTTTIHVSLLDLNDEPPVFEQEEYTVNVTEDAGADFSVATIVATDKDKDDVVKYSLLGSADKNFRISDAGLITTKFAKVFDYEKMTVVIVQVLAQDSLYEKPHRATAQLTINVLDVNDETPSISVEGLEISVQENEVVGKLINDKTKITATDPDTEPLLEFSINWGRSVAIKNGQKVQHGIGCVMVETNFNPPNTATANLRVSDNKKCVLDYELFDTLNIFLVVTDKNQKIGNDKVEVQITIGILDVNDNDPEFVQETVGSKKKVIERSAESTVIGTVTAIDKDGPGNNVVIYSIRPVDDKTPDTWVAIHESLGEIFVKTGNKIDADTPPIKEIRYMVKASDSERFTETEISIEVIDTNNKIPTCTFPTEVHIPESSETGTIVQFPLKCEDKDRDDDYHTPWFQLASDSVKKLFSIDTFNGTVKVLTTQPEIDLDRESETTKFKIPFRVNDNYYRTNTNIQQGTDYSFTIILDDINDNAPIIETNELRAIESMVKDNEIGSIIATDKDEANTDNSKINFEIVEIVKVGDGAVDLPKDLFTIRVDNHFSAKATLLAGQALRSHYGTYEVKIKAEDYGTPHQETKKSLKVTVDRYNFLPPIFKFPLDNDIIYLAKDQPIKAPLNKMSGGPLEPLRVSDQQNEKWDIVITIDTETNPNTIFGIHKLQNNKANLILNASQGNITSIKLKLIADCQCKGEEPKKSEILVNIRFVDTTTEPIFPNTSAYIVLPEGETGLTETLPKAFFNAEGEQWANFTPYYFLQPTAMAQHFKIGKENAVLTLIEELDREAVAQFQLKVTTSKNSAGIIAPANSSVLTVSVTVQDKNDETPKFTKEQYNQGIKASDVLDSSILTLQAIDLDDEGELCFNIEGRIEAVGDEINNLNVPFYLKPGAKLQQGNIIADVHVHLNFSVQSSMAGYFRFKVMVIDGADHRTTTTVKIYIVADSNKVTFRFQNERSLIQSKEELIKETLGKVFGYVCHIEAISRSTNDAGEVIDGQTDVVVYFVDEKTNEAVASKYVLQLLSNPEIFAKIKSPLQDAGIELLNTNNPTQPEDSEGKYKAWLIAVSVVLGTLCIVLIIAFIIKTRSLLKRLNKLSCPKFGSQESGLNRIGLAAPTTNKNTTEGSNPVFRDGEKAQEIDRDRYSMGSGDSDLIGIEDNPNFDYKSDLKTTFINPASKK
ncbi:protein dachsous-like [Photinus pyralis]|uniref:protein dachsous-like n=1 Tax=Photinus pyralis TaxID=7054 RepID=UPI001266E6D6|nr:protein dachsous-like [Photinus pyralis]